MESSFSLNPLMALAGLPVAYVFFWFLRQRYTATALLVACLLFLVFARGTLEILGLSMTLSRLLIEVVILLLFLKGFLSKRLSKSYPGLFWLVGFIAISALSLWVNGLSLPLLLLFLRDYLFILLLFYGLLNINLNAKEVDVLERLLVALFISQIFANIIKVLVLRDIIEPYIGSMANLGGSLTVMFALFGGAYCIALYLVTKQKVYLLWLLGFVLFSMLGGKRATVAYFPVLYLFIFAIHQKFIKKQTIFSIRQWLLFSVMTLFIVYFSIRLFPSLNEEREVWGSFDLAYALDYSDRYMTTGAGAIEAVGRLDAPGYLLGNTFADGLDKFLIGYGTGHLIKSRFNPVLKAAGSQQDATEYLYGVGYAARTTFLQLFLQVGMLGVVFYVGTVWRIFRFCLKKSKLHDNFKESSFIVLFSSGLCFLFFLDYFSYSVKFSTISSVGAVTFITLALFFKKHKISSKGCSESVTN